MARALAGTFNNNESIKEETKASTSKKQSPPPCSPSLSSSSSSSSKKTNGYLRIKGHEIPSQRRKKNRQKQIRETEQDTYEDSKRKQEQEQDKDFDESLLSPEEHRKRYLDQQSSEQNNLYQDHADQYYTHPSKKNKYSKKLDSREPYILSGVPSEWTYQGVGSSSQITGVNDHFVTTPNGALLNCVLFDQAMDEETYTEHIRYGMWRRTHREEVERREKAERENRERAKKLRREAKERAQKLKQDRERYEEFRAEKERLEREAEIATKRSQAAQTRKHYDDSWTILGNKKKTSSSSSIIHIKDIPWPVHPQYESDVNLFTKQNISSFLVGHLHTQDVSARKQTIRTAVMAYHPDRFERVLQHLDPSVNEKEKQDVREKALWVSQVLNQLLSDLSSKAR